MAEWAVGVTLEDIPEQVIEHAKLHLLDATGIHLASRGTETGLVALMTGSVMSPVCRDGILIACLDFDDTHDATLIHASSVVVPALYELLRQGGIPVRALLTGLVVGYELCCRVGLACNGELHPRGFHPTGVVGPVGAAAVAAKARGFEARRMEDALGLASSFGAGLTQCMADGGEARYVHPGIAAANGLLAVALADGGYRGRGAGIEGPAGLLSAHVQDPARLRVEAATNDLGRCWTMLGLNAKPYPTGYVTHEFIDAVLEARTAYALSCDGIQRIACRLPTRASRLVFDPVEEKRRPDRSTAARVALPHILAEALVYGEITAKSFSNERLFDERVRALADRIDAEPVADTDANGLLITLTDGRVVEVPTRRREVSPHDIVTKFLSNASGRVPMPPTDLANEILHSDRSGTLSLLTEAVRVH
jgi:2-methylcitrate dehydratase PrpD